MEYILYFILMTWHVILFRMLFYFADVYIILFCCRVYYIIFYFYFNDTHSPLFVWRAIIYYLCYFIIMWECYIIFLACILYFISHVILFRMLFCWRVYYFILCQWHTLTISVARHNLFVLYYYLNYNMHAWPSNLPVVRRLFKM